MIKNVSYFLFHLSDALIYIILALRIQMLYLGSMFELSPVRLYTLFSAIGVYSAPYIMYIDWFLIDDPLASTLLAVAAILHCTVATYALYLFVAPIRQMIGTMDDWNREFSARPLYLVMIKSSI